MKRGLLFILLMLAFAGRLEAKKVHNFFSHFGSESGLTDIHIRNICQDSCGRIWIGTSAGVHYYNGEKFVPFNNPGYLETCSKMTFMVAEDNNKRIWIASSTETGYYSPQYETFTPVEGIEGPVRDIDIGRDGNIWLTSHSGIWIVRNGDLKAELIISDDDFTPHKTYYDTFQERLLILSSDGSIYSFNPSRGDLPRLIKTSTSEYGFTDIIIPQRDVILTARTDGIVESMNLNTFNTTTIYDLEDDRQFSSITCLLMNGDEYWIGTTTGVVIINRVTGEIDNQSMLETKSRYSVCGNTVRWLLRDIDGNVWVGTYNNGIYLNYYSVFERYTNDRLFSPMTGRSIRAICSDKEGSIWIGSEEGTLCHFDVRQNIFTDYTDRTGLHYGTIITSITYWQSKLWITTYGEGIIVFDPESKKVERRLGGDNGRYFCIMPDYAKTLFIGSSNGICTLDTETNYFTQLDLCSGVNVHSIVKDKYGRIFIGTYEKGLVVWDRQRGDVLDITSDKNLFLIRPTDINEVYIDSSEHVWICSAGFGITRLKLDRAGNVEESELFTNQNGLPSSDVSSIIESNDGTFWAATTNGLAEISADAQSINKVYLQADMVIGSHLISNASYKSSDGRIYMGTARGMFSFDPKQIKDQFDKSLAITEISYGSQLMETGITTKNVLLSKGIRIKQKEADYLSLAFSTMSYSNPNVENYDCTLAKSGYSEYLSTNKNSIEYLKLKPGKYTFTVSLHGAVSPDAMDNFNITIISAWYFSHVARLCYLLCLLTLVILLQRHLKKERKRVQDLDTVRNHMLELHERMEFVTNITHEIRTPLSIMSILMGRFSDNGHFSRLKKEDADSLKVNINRLLEMCNQILDFRKMENGQIRLMITDIDLCELLTTVTSSFSSIASGQGISYSVNIPDSPVMVKADYKSIEGILFNLLSNAVKYCGSIIEVFLIKADHEAVIRVNNDGDKITKEDSELIFNAFYRVDKAGGYGTGLGLAYSRSLALMNYGKLYYDSDCEDMNSFIMSLPLSSSGDLQCSSSDENADLVIEDKEYIMTDDHHRVILVVEDNENLKKLISSELSTEYNTLTASNGAEAMEMIQNNQVDMVISDIIMPEMDGCQLCNAIKTDINYSHILVVLLTAAIGVENHIRSLKAGADGYIEKPFKMELLKANINNLFKNIDIMKMQFSKSPEILQTGLSTASEVDKTFMVKLYEYITKNISETSLNSEKLAEVMRISRKNMIHKIKANTGMSVNEYIRACRLKAAAELLARNEYRINEVAYLVGYSTPSYFTKHFEKQFGIKPSEFIKMRNGQSDKQ